MIQTNTGNRLNGFFRGEVVKHCLCGNGMCKVWIPGVYDVALRDQPDSLPDAEQISPLFGGSCSGNGVFSYPNLHSIVICGFYNDDQNQPFFFGSTLGGQQAFDKYKNCQKNVTEDTIKSGQDAYNHIFSVGQSKVEMNESGYIDIIAKGDKGGSNNVHIVCDGKGNLIIDTTQQVQITSPNIKMTAGQSFELTSPQIKINAGQSYELNTKTLKENVQTNADITAQDISLMGGNTINLVTPTTNIDTSTGSTTIKGSQHVYFFG